MKIIEEIREFLKDNNIDYLLVNSTNEFLVEYAPLSENARYFLTKFSGSTGDAVISQKDIFLFVDGRYHEQADAEVDKNSVIVVKMKIGESFIKLLAEKIKPDTAFAVVAKKVSQGRLEILRSAFIEKNVKINLLSFDPVLPQKDKQEKTDKNIVEIDKKICGLSSAEKFKKIAKNLKSDEAIFTTNLEEISYFCNLRDFSLNYSSKIQDGKLIITNANFKLLTSDNYEYYIKNLDKIKTIFVDKNTISAYDYAILGKKATNLKENYIKQLKSVKTPAEINHYKKCFVRTDKALLATRNFINENENISEFDIAKNLEENFYKFGAKLLSFKSIVAKDKNAALAHYSKNSKDEILKEGSLILIDCGAYYEGGYATDCTRVFVKGTPSQLQKDVYTTVLKGFLKAFNKKITSNTTGFSLDKAARKVLNENKPSGFEFSHSLGHGIGISVHESPPTLAFSPLAKTNLVPNMCFTIEPGLYNPKNFGVRLENSCFLSKQNGELIIRSFSDMCFEKKLINFDKLTQTEKKQIKFFKVK